MTNRFKEFLHDHDYYCHTSNYYSNKANEEWDSWEDFYNEYFDADIDYNLIFRWDLRENEDEKDINKKYYLEVFMIHQRKGIFSPHVINNIKKEDIEEIEKLLKPHWDKLVEIWRPISK